MFCWQVYKQIGTVDIHEMSVYTLTGLCCINCQNETTQLSQQIFAYFQCWACVKGIIWDHVKVNSKRSLELKIMVIIADSIGIKLLRPDYLLAGLHYNLIRHLF